MYKESDIVYCKYSYWAPSVNANVCYFVDLKKKQIKQLIENNKQPRFSGSKGQDEVVCNFTDGTLIKRMYVSPTTQKFITQGKLAVVKFGEGYELVPMPVADKISERDEACVVYRADNISQEDQKSSEDDDWYADYEIPDDLNW